MSESDLHINCGDLRVDKNQSNDLGWEISVHSEIVNFNMTRWNSLFGMNYEAIGAREFISHFLSSKFYTFYRSNENMKISKGFLDRE